MSVKITNSDQIARLQEQSPKKDLNSGFVGEAAFDEDAVEGESESFKPLSREEAKALSQKLSSQQAPLSLLRVLVWQAITGLLLALCVWIGSGNSGMGWSVLYGSFCVVVPAAIFARGFGRQMAFGQSGTTVPAGAAMVGFFIWELVKVVLTVVMLLAAPKIVLQLNWLALLAGFVVTMKVYWVAAWLGLGRKSRIKK